MVARISVGKNLYGALAYNQNKVDEGGAKVLSAHLLRYPEDGRFRPDESVRQFLEWMPNHYRTEKPVSQPASRRRADRRAAGGNRQGIHAAARLR